jgi:hypothetical protein
MKPVFLLCMVTCLTSCWKYPPNYTRNNNQPSAQKVWGNKPIYAAIAKAKQITYIAQKQPIKEAGNIYAKGNFIFQVDVGRGIHVIDNTIPAKADRVGFITVNGCSQMSIRGNYLYTNSIADLVTIDITDPLNLREVNRIPNAFPEFNYNYPLIQPSEKGYYTCPGTDSIVIGWVKDSIYTTCYKS